MRHVFRLTTIACCISLVVGCSNGSGGNDDTGDGNGSNMDGSVDNGADGNGIDGNGMETVACNSGGSATSALDSISSQTRESDPAAIDVAVLSSTLSNLANGCAQAEPTAVNPGEGVSDILTRINTRG